MQHQLDEKTSSAKLQLPRLLGLLVFYQQIRLIFHVKCIHVFMSNVIVRSYTSQFFKRFIYYFIIQAYRAKNVNPYHCFNYIWIEKVGFNMYFLATEYHLGLLKAKLARYRAQLIEPSSKSGAKVGLMFRLCISIAPLMYM